MNAGETIEELRRHTFAIAYRMLGSVADAEDVVQEALLRMHRVEAEGERIESRRAYLSTVVTRLAIDELRSARARRETYVGEWLPEPLVEVPREPGPAEQAELAESLSVAFMVLLESLSPEQRAAFLLHDVFDYPYGEVAEIVGKSETSTRQLASRARRAVAARRPRFEASREERDQLADRFFAAVIDGQLAELERLLAEDVELHGDGGGRAPALARVLSGASLVARTLVGWGRIAGRVQASARQLDINGQPGALIVDEEGRVISAISLEIRDGGISAIHSVVNPEKLTHLGAVTNLGSILRRSAAARGQQPYQAEEARD